MKPVDAETEVDRRNSDYWSTYDEVFYGGWSKDGRITISGVEGSSVWRTRVEFHADHYGEARFCAEADTFRTTTSVPFSVDQSGETVVPSVVEKDGTVLIKLWPDSAGPGGASFQAWTVVPHWREGQP